MRLQPGQDIRPASVAGACTLTREARVGQTNRRGATLLLQIDAHEALRRVLLPVGKPCKGEQTRSIDLGVYSAYYERFPTDADAAHHPLAAGPQVRLHVRYLKSRCCTRPRHTFLRIGPRPENSYLLT